MIVQKILKKLKIPYFVWKTYAFEDADDFVDEEQIIVLYNLEESVNMMGDLALFKMLSEGYDNIKKGLNLWEIPDFFCSNSIEFEIFGDRYDVKENFEVLDKKHIPLIFKKANIESLPIEYYNKPYDYLYKTLNL